MPVRRRQKEESHSSFDDEERGGEPLRRRRGRRAMVAPAAGQRGEVSNCGFGGEARRIRGGGRDII